MTILELVHLGNPNADDGKIQLSIDLPTTIVGSGQRLFGQEKVSSGKVVVFNLKGDRVEVNSKSKRTGLVKVGNKYRTIIKDGDKTIIAKSYNLLPFGKKVYRPKGGSDFNKGRSPGSSLLHRGREGESLAMLLILRFQDS